MDSKNIECRYSRHFKMIRRSVFIPERLLKKHVKNFNEIKNFIRQNEFLYFKLKNEKRVFYV